MEVDVSADEEKSIAERVDGLKTIFKSEFVAGGKEKYFIAPDEDSSPAEDPVKSATDDQFFNAFNTLNLTSDEYQEMINDFCARISKKEGDYQTKVETYRNTRRSGQDSSIATYSDVGANCQMQEVSLLATECQSRVSSVDGPARQRYLAKQPRVKIRGLSEVETQVVQTNHREKELWNRILREETANKWNLKDKQERSDADQNLKSKRNFLNGFERMIPTEAELRTSLNRWDRGIFGAWSQDDPEATFPVVQWEKYESKICHDEKQNILAAPPSNRFLAGESMRDGFHNHWDRKCLILADQALAEAKEKKKQGLSTGRADKRQLHIRESLENIEVSSAPLSSLDFQSDQAVYDITVSQTDSNGIYQNAKAEEESTRTPNTDEGIFGNSLQLLSSVASNAPTKEVDDNDRISNSTPGIIRRTLLSMIKLPKGIKKPSHSKLSAPSITSHTTGSVVLTKLDGGGSYHSTSKEDQSQTDISNQERFSGSTSRKIELSAHPLTPRRILFFKDISLRFNFFTSLLRRANSATIVPSFDDPRTMVGDETLQPTQFSKETVDNPQNSDGLKKSTRKYQQIRFTETLPRLHEKDSDLKRSAQEKQMPPFKEILRRKLSDSNIHILKERFPVRTELEQGSRRSEFTETAFLNPHLTMTEVILVETLFRIQNSRSAALERFSKLVRLLSMGQLCKDDHLVYTADDLRIQALRGHYETVVRIMDHWSSPSPNDPCHNGETPFYALLMHLLTEDTEDTEQYSLTFGILPRMWKFITAKFKRSETSNLALVLKIFDHRGVDVNTIRNQPDEENLAPVHIAAANNLFGLLKWLVVRKVNINSITTKFHKTPLMIAAERGHGEMVHFLLHLGATTGINLIDADGNTALHYAALHCPAEYVECLLLCGANISLRNKKNRLPIEEAKKRKRDDVVAVFSILRDRSRLRKHQIRYYEGEVRQGRTGGADGGTITSSSVSVKSERD